MKREVLQSSAADVSFVKGHGKQRTGVYYNIAEKAEMTNNYRAAEAKNTRSTNDDNPNNCLNLFNCIPPPTPFKYLEKPVPQ